MCHHMGGYPTLWGCLTTGPEGFGKGEHRGSWVQGSGGAASQRDLATTWFEDHSVYSSMLSLLSLPINV